MRHESFPFAAVEAEAAINAGGAALLEELALLAQMPQVRLTEKSVFDRAKTPGTVAQQRGVQFRLRCCTGPPLVKKCNDLSGEKACPTVLDAVTALRLKVQNEHGSEACRERATAAAAAEGSSSAAVEQPEDAFKVMLGARLAIQRAQSALTQAEQRAEQRRAQVADDDSTHMRKERR